MVDTLDCLTIVVTGLMVGNELAVAEFMHPALFRLADDAHAPAAQDLARRLGRVMPLWYGLSLLLMLVDLYVRWHGSGRVPTLTVIGAVLMGIVILFTLAALVPVNTRIAKLDPANPHAGWKADRKRWDTMHQVRVMLLVVSFTLFTAGVLQALR